MWVLYNPLIRFLGERRVIILGLFINFLFFVGYLFLVTSLAWVFLFTAVGMVGMVNFPTVSSMKSQKCSPAEQGQVRSCPSKMPVSPF